jgi:hypothetical protein
MSTSLSTSHPARFGLCGCIDVNATDPVLTLDLSLLVLDLSLLMLDLSLLVLDLSLLTTQPVLLLSSC